jgi:hypothetical protein
MTAIQSFVLARAAGAAARAAAAIAFTLDMV